MKRLLITGANGFIGKALINVLHLENYSLRTAGRSHQDDDPGENIIVNDYVFFDLDDENYNYDKLLDGIDIIIHLASRVHMIGEQDDELEAYRKTNHFGVERLAGEAAERGIKRFIFLSSIKVNGEKNISNEKGEVFKFNESDVPHPQGAYAISKLEAEDAIRKICHESKMDFVILRPTLVYGPGVSANFLSLLDAVNKNYPLPLASVKSKRSLLYVGNLIHSITLSVSYPGKANRIFLLSDIDISVPQLIRKIASLLGKRALLFHFPVNCLKVLGSLIGKRSVIDRLTDSLLVDSTSIHKDLNWEPLYSFDEGLQETLDWYLQR